MCYRERIEEGLAWSDTSDIAQQQCVYVWP